ncbi:MAG TPA: radical SAM protein [Vicinamibacteria bacterium]|nr:radical SAM protein [Vicinamibacteria bacterium]
MATGLVDRINGSLLAHRVGGMLTGSYDDLRRLVATMNARPPRDSAGLMMLLRTMERDIETRTGVAALFARLGRQLNPRAKRKLLRNLIYNWAAVGARRRNRIAADGRWVPSFVVLSPTMRCNLKCTGCYSGLYSKKGELSEAEIRRILDECRSFGAYFVVVSGGEPYLLRDMWLRIFRDYGDMYFLTYTNGTLLDPPTVDALARLGNVAPGISVEGFREATDRRRGEGVHGRALLAAERLKDAGVLFGVSVTYTRQNLAEVTSDAFVRDWIERGAIFAWYFMFMPVGKDPLLELVPTPEQRIACGARIAALRREQPIFLADFWNDGPASAGCLAARTYLHVLNSGQIEPCVFAHFGLHNIRTTSIVEAVNSPFFQAIRRAFPYSDDGNLRRPCMIVDNPQVLRKVVAEHVVPAGHEHSEDIIKDPGVVAWVDAYAARLKSLADPLWERQIQDPSDRWYREGQEYKNLFRFRPKADRPEAQS